jgi:hypothetical protein
MSNSEPSAIVLQGIPCMCGLYKLRLEPIVANQSHYQAAFGVAGKGAKQSNVFAPGGV